MEQIYIWGDVLGKKVKKKKTQDTKERWKGVSGWYELKMNYKINFYNMNIWIDHH